MSIKAKDILKNWAKYIEVKKPADTEWHDITDGLALFGFRKVRNNKDYSYTVDLIHEDGTCYYAVYPVAVGAESSTDNQFSITINFKGVNNEKI